MLKNETRQQGPAGDQSSGMVRATVYALALAAAVPLAARAAEAPSDAEARLGSLVGQMTLDKNVAQLLNVAPALPRLEIPAFNMVPQYQYFPRSEQGARPRDVWRDPHLTAALGVAFIRSIQGRNPDLPDVIATQKHFVHSGPESTRHMEAA